jgi:hypothetical protein
MLLRKRPEQPLDTYAIHQFGKIAPNNLAFGTVTAYTEIAE